MKNYLLELLLFKNFIFLYFFSEINNFKIIFVRLSVKIYVTFNQKKLCL